MGQRVLPCWATLPKVENFNFWGWRSHPREPIGVKLHTTKRTYMYVPLGCAKFHVNRCKESPMRGENADFWPMSENNYVSLLFRGILPLIKTSIVHKSIVKITYVLQDKLETGIVPEDIN